MDINYDDVFKFCILASKFSRSDPTLKRDAKWLIQFMIVHAPYTTIVIIMMQNICCVNWKENDLSLMCKNGTFVIVYLEITLFHLIMSWKRKYMNTIANFMKKDYELAKSLSLKEQAIIRKYAHNGKFACQQWFFISVVGIALFPIKNLILHIYYACKNEFHLIPLYDLVYPDFIDNRKHNILVYAFTYLHFFICECYTGLMYTSFIPLGPIFMLHACGQLEVVKSRMLLLFEDADVREVNKRLKDIVQRMQYIYDFVAIIQSTFMEAYEFLLKGCNVVIPVTLFAILESLYRGEITLEFLTFCGGGVFVASATCYYSDKLLEKGEDLMIAIYSCGWEKVRDRGVRTTVCFMLQRSSRRVGIRSLFRDISLVALAEVFQQSYALFNLMCFMWK